MPKLFVGIDPGKTGCVVLHHPKTGTEVLRFKEPGDDVAAVRAVRDIVDNDELDPFIRLEEVGGFIAGKASPGSAMFNFGRSYGRIQGALEAFGLPYHLVKPQVWQKGISGVAGLKGKDRKRALKAEAVRRHPRVKITDDVADALLLADYAKTTSL